MTNSKMFDLSGKVAVVTGGSRGIGRSICEQMAAHGAKVIVSSRKLPVCEEVVKGIKEKGGEATAVAASISDKAQLEALVAFARKTYGKIDIMVCNAAINPHHGPIDTLTDEAFERMMTNNVQSNFWFSLAVAPGMRERKDGSIIFIISVAAQMAGPAQCSGTMARRPPRRIRPSRSRLAAVEPVVTTAGGAPSDVAGPRPAGCAGTGSSGNSARAR